MDKDALTHHHCTITFGLLAVVALMVFALSMSYLIIDKADGEYYKATTTVVGKYRGSDDNWNIVSKPVGVIDKTEWTVDAATYLSYDKGDKITFWTSFRVLYGTVTLNIACVFVYLLTFTIIILGVIHCLVLLCDLE